MMEPVVIVCLLLIVLVLGCMLSRYESALWHIRFYGGDCADAKEQAEVAYNALHPWRPKE